MWDLNCKVFSSVYCNVSVFVHFKCKLYSMFVSSVWSYVRIEMIINNQTKMKVKSIQRNNCARVCFITFIRNNNIWSLRDAHRLALTARSRTSSAFISFRFVLYYGYLSYYYLYNSIAFIVRVWQREKKRKFLYFANHNDKIVRSTNKKQRNKPV